MIVGRDRMLRAAGDRSPEVVAWAALCAGAAACLAVAVLFPMSEHAPVELGYVLIGVALAMAAATWQLGDRVPRGVLLAAAALSVVLNSVLVAEATTAQGAVGDAFAYGWLAAYAALFFPRSAHRFAALVAAGFGLGLLASDLPGMFTPWAVVSITTWTFAAVLSRMSRLVRIHLQTDVLTGAVNRRGLHAAAHRAVAHARRARAPLTVVAIDLDAFKQVNDLEGHDAGDRLLVEAAERWRTQLRAGDVLARTGGDEFVLVMPGTEKEEAVAVLARLRAASPAAFSAGIARWRSGEPFEACLKRADERLYAAKLRPGHR